MINSLSIEIKVNELLIKNIDEALANVFIKKLFSLFGKHVNDNICEIIVSTDLRANMWINELKPLCRSVRSFRISTYSFNQRDHATEIVLNSFFPYIERKRFSNFVRRTTFQCLI